MPRAQLTTDLNLGANAMQTSLPPLLQCTKSIHDLVCSCGTGSSVGGVGGAGYVSGLLGAGGMGGAGGVGGAGGMGGAGGAGGHADSSGCAVGGDDQGGLLIAGVLAALALAASRRKRTRR